MSRLLHILAERHARLNEYRQAMLHACELDGAEWIAQDREGEWYAYHARPVPAGLGWECEEKAIYLFRGRPNGQWPESMRKAPQRKRLVLLCHSPCSELPQRLAAMFS